MERPRIVVLAIGHDRPGLIAGLTSVIAEMNGNIEDFDSVVLCGPIFVMSMVVDVSKCSSSLDSIERKLKGAGRQIGLSVTVYRCDQLSNE